VLYSRGHGEGHSVNRRHYCQVHVVVGDFGAAVERCLLLAAGAARAAISHLVRLGPGLIRCLIGTKNYQERVLNQKELSEASFVLNQKELSEASFVPNQKELSDHRLLFPTTATT
jgi:hypothetical protein